MSPSPEQYRDQPGAIPLTSTNVAPRKGSQLVGYVPFGLTAVVGENEAGKSRLLSALLAIPLEAKHPEDLVTVTRGESTASVSLGAAELRIEERVAGGVAKRRPQRAGAAATSAPIGRLPDPIGLMISGGDHVDPDANWRTRLKALLAFYPVAVNEERLAALSGCLPNPDGDVAGELQDAHGASPFPSLLEAADWLADGKRGILHKRKRQAKDEAEKAAAAVERQYGKLSELQRSAAAAAGLELEDDRLRRGLEENNPLMAGAQDHHRQLATALATLEVRLSDRMRAVGERASLRATIGERPGSQSEEELLAGVQEAQRESEVELARIRESVAVVRERTIHADAGRGERLTALTEAAEAWGTATGQLQRTLPTWGHDGSALHAKDLLGPVRSTLLALEYHIEALVSADEACAKAGAESAAVEQALVAAETSARELEEMRKDADARLAAARSRQEAWARIQRELATKLEPINPGPLEEVVRAPLSAFLIAEEPELDSIRHEVIEAAKAAVKDAAGLAALAEAAPRYREAKAAHQRLEVEAAAATDRSERLEAAAHSTWDRLGDVISSALLSRFVRVGKRTIEVSLDDGRWVDVADDVELSQGRLRRAFLDFYLERTDAGERTVVVSDDVMLPIGLDGRSEINARAAAKQIRLIFEQPRIGDDAPGLHLVWYGDAQ